ncbi:MAG: transcription termination factor Rho [Gemmatimonadota bacterium]
MPHSFEELKGKTVAQLREIAEGIEHDALHGFSTMHKEHLIPALCEALGIEAHEHHEVVGIDKSKVKARIRELKTERDTALEARDLEAARTARREIKKLKRKLRRAIV